MSHLPKKSISEARMGSLKKDLVETGKMLASGAIMSVNCEHMMQRVLNKYFETCEIDIDDMKAGEEVGCAY